MVGSIAADLRGYPGVRQPRQHLSDQLTDTHVVWFYYIMAIISAVSSPSAAITQVGILARTTEPSNPPSLQLNKSSYACCVVM